MTDAAASDAQLPTSAAPPRGRAPTTSCSSPPTTRCARCATPWACAATSRRCRGSSPARSPPSSCVTPLFAALVERLPRRRFLPLVYHFFAANLVAFFFVLHGTPSTFGGARLLHLDLGLQPLRRQHLLGLHGRSLRRRRRRAPLRRHRARRHARRHGRRRHHDALRRARRRDQPDAARRAAPRGRRPLLLSRRRRQRDLASAMPTIPRKPVWHFAVVLARSPYLLALAGYMLVYTITSTFAYLEQARLVQAAVHGDAARTALFARMDLAVNLASIVLQASLTALLLRRAGVTATLLVLPVVTLRRLRRARRAPVAGADRRLPGRAPHRRLLRRAPGARALLRRRRPRGEVRRQELHRHLHLPRRRRRRRQRLRPRRCRGADRRRSPVPLWIALLFF